MKKSINYILLLSVILFSSISSQERQQRKEAKIKSGFLSGLEFENKKLKKKYGKKYYNLKKR